MQGALGLALGSLAAIWLRPLVPLVAVLDAALVALVLLDLARTPSPSELHLARELPETAGLSRPLRRTIAIDLARTRRPARFAGLWLELAEEFPSSFEVLARSAGDARALARTRPAAGDPSGGPDRVRLPAAGATARLVRVYRGARRGVFELGAVRVRLRGRLGLVERQARLEGTQSIAIEPALVGLRRTLRLAASERWWDLGVRRLRRIGGRTEFESLRDYVPGDDVRQVDWKAFARRGRPMVRQHQEERGQELLLVVDTGRRMRATDSAGKQRGWTKLDWALDAALELAAVALQRGDRVGIAAFDRRLSSFVAPARGARQLARLREAVFALQPLASESDLLRSLRELAVRHRRRALVLVLSDVADAYSLAAQRRALASASRRHRLLFAALDDPELRRSALDQGDLDGADALARVALRAAALRLVDERRESLRALASSGARVLDAVPAELAGPLLAAWLDERRRA